ncbi:hypothetical protein ABEDC_1465 [Acinetobacter lwoffii]|nr:hypothetical protein ABEDC_1465 [Acinetobacter lwoffii]
MHHRPPGESVTIHYQKSCLDSLIIFYKFYKNLPSSALPEKIEAEAV